MIFRQSMINEVIYQIENPVKSVVYFILAEAEGFDSFVKIGISINVDRRFQEILKDIEKTGVYPDYLGDGICDSLYLLGVIEGTQTVETALHRAFKDKALGKEWFEYDDEMEEIIDDLLDSYCKCTNCSLLDQRISNSPHRSEQDLSQ